MLGLGFYELLILMVVGAIGFAGLAAVFFLVLAAVRAGKRKKGSGD
jgi:hypothetical protein